MTWPNYEAATMLDLHHWPGVPEAIASGRSWISMNPINHCRQHNNVRYRIALMNTYRDGCLVLKITQNHGVFWQPCHEWVIPKGDLTRAQCLWRQFCLGRLDRIASGHWAAFELEALL